MRVLAVWLIAAFFAALLSCAPNAAFAHEGHDHGMTAAPQGATAGGHDAARVAAASISPSVAASPAPLALSRTAKLEKAFASVKPSAATPVMTGNVPSSCHGTCCNMGGCGSGCCAAVGTIAESLNPRSSPGSAKLRLPSDLAVAGKRPSTLLEPPTALA
jgi:hypothetical protein